jgi:hypothetical protein
MIVFELICDKQHRFEGWFSSPEDFGAQQEKGLLSCPVCADRGINKLLTAKIGRTDHSSRPMPSNADANLPVSTSGSTLQAKLHELIDHVLANTEDVGPEFASEARKIHYQEAPKREIRGTTSADEAKELLEEGIPILPLPIPPKSDWH